MRIITVFALIFGMVLAGGAVATEFAVDLQTTSLIVKFERNATDAIYPEDAVDVVSEVASGQDAALTGTDWSIYTRIGSPASATWLIRHRFPADYLEALRAEDPDHPELHLQEYVVLQYADSERGSPRRPGCRPTWRCGRSARTARCASTPG